jgi:hypothetical protein
MKKITLLAVAFVAISFASCKKYRTCECTFTDSNGQTETMSVTSTTKMTKKDAKAQCESSNSGDMSCKLKK